MIEDKRFNRNDTGRWRYKWWMVGGWSVDETVRFKKGVQEKRRRREVEERGEGEWQRRETEARGKGVR